MSMLEPEWEARIMADRDRSNYERGLRAALAAANKAADNEPDPQYGADACIQAIERLLEEAREGRGGE